MAKRTSFSSSPSLPAESQYLNNNHNKKLGVQKIIAPPENLPIEVEPRYMKPVLRFGFVVVLVFVLLTAGITFSKESFKNVYGDIEEITKPFAQSFGSVAKDIKTFSSGSYPIRNAISNGAGQIADIGGLFQEYGQWIVRSYFTANNFIEEKLIHGYKAFSRLWKESGEVVEEKLIPEPVKEGMVVVPSTKGDEEVKKRIKESFSDEVRVELQDESSGIIIPIFKKGEGEKYLYILVPILKKE